MATILSAKHLITANAIIDQPLITVDCGTIVDISSRKATESTGPTHDFEDGTLAAGLLDIHMHGAIGHDVMKDAIDAAAGQVT